MQGGKIWLKFGMERASATQILPTNQNQWKIQTKQQPLINFTRIFGFDMEFSFAAGDHGSSKRQFYLTAIHLPILSLRSTELFAIFALFTHTQTNTHTHTHYLTYIIIVLFYRIYHFWEENMKITMVKQKFFYNLFFFLLTYIK